jgi:hypothetical protein
MSSLTRHVTCEGPALGPARLLTIGFEGYFMCRLATDPDPTNETRGMSGYTMALSTEQALDYVIRLQASPDFVAKNLRPPAHDMGIQIGVDIKSVAYDGKPWPGHPLEGASVRLKGRDEPAAGPTFESRNNITGSDDNFAFVIDPFHLYIESRDRSLSIEAQDHIDPTHKDRPIWEVVDPAVYGRRLPIATEEPSNEVAAAINVFDLYGYFRDRRRYLKHQIDLGETALMQGIPAVGEGEIGDEEKNRESIELRNQQYRSRLYQLEFWGDRIIQKIGTKVTWAFDINGRQHTSGDLLGTADTSQPWRVEFWFGGWDGDLLTGFFRGSLRIPFTKRD